jgi:hypothetical protein
VLCVQWAELTQYPGFSLRFKTMTQRALKKPLVSQLSLLPFPSLFIFKLPPPPCPTCLCSLVFSSSVCPLLFSQTIDLSCFQLHCVHSHQVRVVCACRLQLLADKLKFMEEEEESCSFSG